MTYRNQRLVDLYHDQDQFTGAIAQNLEDPKQVILSFAEATAVTGSMAWKPGRKVEITGIKVANGDVAIAAATNTTVIGIDVYNAAGDAKQADLADKAVGVAIGVRENIALTLIASVAGKIIEADESMQIIRTIAGTQGECSVCVRYRHVD